MLFPRATVLSSAEQTLLASIPQVAPIGPIIRPSLVSGTSSFSGTPCVTPSQNDALRDSRPLISISGQTFNLPAQSVLAMQHSLSLASSFNLLFHSSSVSLLPVSSDLAVHFHIVQKIFAPDAFETAALAFVKNFHWTDEI